MKGLWKIEIIFKLLPSRTINDVISKSYSGGFLIVKQDVDSITTRDIVIDCSLIEEVLTDYSNNLANKLDNSTSSCL